MYVTCSSKSHENEDAIFMIEATGAGVVFLPPYSPELNPIERVWKLTRRLAVHNRYFPSLESVSGAIEFVFNNWVSGNKTLKKLCAII